MAAETRDFFFSYSRQDSDFVLMLANELRARGASLWLDQIDLLGGERWDEAITEALRSSGGLVVVLSPDSVQSSNVKDEVAYALEEGKKVIPVLHRPCEIPFRLRRLHYIDFTGDYDRALTALRRAMQAHGGASAAESEIVTRPSRTANTRARGRGAVIGFVGFGAVMVAALVGTSLLPTEVRPPFGHDMPGILAFMFVVAGILGATASLLLDRNWKSIGFVIIPAILGWVIGLSLDPRYEGTQVGLTAGALAGIVLAVLMKKLMKKGLKDRK